MSQGFIRGAFLITMGSIIAKIIGSLFRIPLQNIAGNQVFGIYTLVYPVYMVALTIAGAGIPLAISKLIAENRNNGNNRAIQEIFRTSRILAMILGGGSFILIVCYSHMIAELLGGQMTRLALIIVSTTLLVAPFMAVYRGFFQGYENMIPTASSQVIEQFVRVGFILGVAFILVHRDLSPTIITAGVMAGSIVGASISTAYLCGVYHRSKFVEKKEIHFSLKVFIHWSKKILAISIPICIGSMSLAAVYFIDSITVPTLLNKFGHEKDAITELYGFYGRGQALVQMVVVLAQSLVLSIIPTITSALVKGNKLEVQNITDKAIHFTHLISWPLTVGLCVLTTPLNYSLFGDVRETVLVSTTLFSALFTAFSVLSTGILQGLNRSIFSAIIIMGCSLLKVVLNIILIEKYSLIGVAISTIIVFATMTLLNFMMVSNLTGVKVWKLKHSVFAGSALVQGFLISIPYHWVKILEWSRIEALAYTVFIFLIGLGIYGVSIVVFKGISIMEVTKIPIIGKCFRPTSYKIGKTRYFK
ncbi:polysaccharide biosynthesis protein [Bacillus sp. T3]|uniref:putative polysaccharide biosynthesis protein n=1 Tax=Bacillus sp. T3 TaxID=467262 RepID=UPI002981618F|nr:polysaccharide biosynthesis protein [Bacillus sp. T3]